MSCQGSRTFHLSPLPTLCCQQCLCGLATRLQMFYTSCAEPLILSNREKFLTMIVFLFSIKASPTCSQQISFQVPLTRISPISMENNYEQGEWDHWLGKINHDSSPQDGREFSPPNNYGYPEEGEIFEVLLTRKRKGWITFATVLNISEPHNGVFIVHFSSKNC